ncbi:MAG: molybdopterin molybdotransferase MoeA [Cyanobacteria bacterium REEB67]|nr:molybdopterin molybdotransferase MoeA [Cyanobacteria bacterium REEB67]
MLTYEQALQEIRTEGARFERVSETINCADALGRVLSHALQAGFDLPRFNNSAVDGYGVLVEDLVSAAQDNQIELIFDGEVAAGADPASLAERALAPGHCLRILTGAPVPESVEAVVMKEYCRIIEAADGAPAKIAFATRTKIGENIRMQGEEVEQGTSVLAPGMAVSPPVIGLLATLGLSEVQVYKQARFAVVATGDELVEPAPGVQLSGAQIYNSNTPALVAALRCLNVREIKALHCLDDRAETLAVLTEALAASDVVLTLGGVSVGERDFVKEAFEELGVRTVFWRVAVKPGKPVYFGVIEKGDRVEKLIFGLPGNPVSALITFNLFVKPALKIIQGLRQKSARITTARLTRNLQKKAGRLDFVRGTLASAADGSLTAAATSGQESHMLTGLAAADCLMLFPQESEFLAEGAAISVQLLNWHD